MVKTGTEPEEVRPLVATDADDAALPVEVVSGDAEREGAVLVHQRRTEVTSKVLDLLTSLGSLVLRIIENRTSTGVTPMERPLSPSVSGMGLTPGRSEESVAFGGRGRRGGGRAQRRRQRRRGPNRGGMR